MGMPAYCNLHGQHRYRPSVERFDPQQQAAFRRFCASLLQFANAAPQAQQHPESAPDAPGTRFQ